LQNNLKLNAPTGKYVSAIFTDCPNKIKQNTDIEMQSKNLKSATNKSFGKGVTKICKQLQTHHTKT